MIFEKGYYIDSAISAYEDYTEKDYSGLAKDLKTELNLNCYTSLLDFGCATGLLVRSLIDQTVFHTIGTDISYWAIDYGRKTYNLSSLNLHHYNRQLLESSFDYILFLDVLEHISLDELNAMFCRLIVKFIVVRVPVSLVEGERYVLDIHEKDKTHIQRHTKEWWEIFFNEYGYGLYKILDTKNIYDSEGVLARVYAKAS